MSVYYACTCSSLLFVIINQIWICGFEWTDCSGLTFEGGWTGTHSNMFFSFFCFHNTLEVFVMLLKISNHLTYQGKLKSYHVKRDGCVAVRPPEHTNHLQLCKPHCNCEYHYKLLHFASHPWHHVFPLQVLQLFFTFFSHAQTMRGLLPVLRSSLRLRRRRRGDRACLRKATLQGCDL